MARNMTLAMFSYFEKEINNNETTQFQGNTNVSIGNVGITEITSNMPGNRSVQSRNQNTGCGYWKTFRLSETFSGSNGETIVQTFEISYYIFCGTMIDGGGGFSSWDPSNVGLAGYFSGGMAGGGGVYYYTNSGGGQATYGWWNYGYGYNGINIDGYYYDPMNMYPSWNGPASVWYPSEEEILLEQLSIQLRLSPNRQYFLLDNLNMVSALYNYLNDTNSTITLEERERILLEHLDKLMTNADYLYFVESYTTNNLNSVVWWENDVWRDDTNNFYLNSEVNEIGNQQYDELTLAEKALVKLYPTHAYFISRNVNVAYSETATRFASIGGFLNGKADAFRHAFFNAMNERDCGKDHMTLQSIAKLFSDAHESEVPAVLDLEKQMDLFNNAVGHIVGDVVFPIFNSNATLANDVMVKYNSGALRYLAPLDFNASNLYDANNDKIQDCPTCLNGILPGITILKPTNQ